MRRLSRGLMRTTAKIGIAGIIGVVLTSQAAAQAPRPTADEAAVGAAIVAVFAAVERGDLAALDTLYAGDSLTIGEGAGLDRTWKSYRDHHLAPELKEMRHMHYRPTEIEARVSGDLAWAIFRYTLRGEVGERTLDIVGRGTAILERRGTRWIVRHSQTSGRARRPSDPPAPAQD